MTLEEIRRSKEYKEGWDAFVKSKKLPRASRPYAPNPYATGHNWASAGPYSPAFLWGAGANSQLGRTIALGSTEVPGHLPPLPAFVTASFNPVQLDLF